MNETISNILSRRSVRAYKREAVPQEAIDQVIQAGLYAASGKNKQSPIIIAVTDPVLRDTLSEMNCRIGGWSPETDPFYGAPVVLIVLANKQFPNYLYDGSLVMGNLMLAAHSLGLGSCWIHRAKQEFESEEGKALLKELGIEGDYEGIGHCILGYPDGPEPQPLPRKDGRVYWVK